MANKKINELVEKPTLSPTDYAIIDNGSETNKYQLNEICEQLLGIKVVNNELCMEAQNV